MSYHDSAEVAEIELDDRNYNPKSSYNSQRYQESQIGSYQGQPQPQYQSRGPSYSSQQQQLPPRVAPRNPSRDGSYQGSQQLQQQQQQPYYPPSVASYSRDFERIESASANLSKQKVQTDQVASRTYSADRVSDTQLIEGPPPVSFNSQYYL